jgi:hypothetical protein
MTETDLMVKKIRKSELSLYGVGELDRELDY